MRIAVVIESFAPQAGGNERSTAQIIERLCDRGHTITLITGTCSREDTPEGVEVICQGRRPKSFLQLLAFRRWAIAQLEAGRFDASLSMTLAVPTDVLQPRGGTVRETLDRNIALRSSSGAQLQKRLAIALNPKQQTLLALERRTLAAPAIKAIAAVSGYVQLQLRKHYDVPADQIHIIANGAGMPEVCDAEREQWRGDIRKAYDIPDDATLFVFAAQNPKLKGFGSLVTALAMLKERGQDVVVLLAGKYRYTHLSWIAQMGVRGMVRMVGQTSRMPVLYCAADVTVLPTYYDPSSKVVLESLMLGTPAISTRFNGASDFIDGPDGMLRGRVIDDPADALALADAMAELCDPQARADCRASMGQISGQVSMDRHVDELEGLLQRIRADSED